MPPPSASPSLKAGCRVLGPALFPRWSRHRRRLRIAGHKQAVLSAHSPHMRVSPEQPFSGLPYPKSECTSKRAHACLKGAQSRCRHRGRQLSLESFLRPSGREASLVWVGLGLCIVQVGRAQRVGVEPGAWSPPIRGGSALTLPRSCPGANGSDRSEPECRQSMTPLSCCCPSPSRGLVEQALLCRRAVRLLQNLYSPVRIRTPPPPSQKLAGE